NLFLRRPDDVCADGEAVEEVDRFVEFDGRGAVSIFRVLQLERRFREMDADRHPGLVRRLARRAQLLLVHRVVRVRPEDGRDAAIATLPALDECEALGYGEI